MEDLIKEEVNITKNLLNLDEVLEFQCNNDIQIIRGSDYQYLCYINNKVYSSGLTPMYALAYGIQKFKANEKT